MSDVLPLPGFAPDSPGVRVIEVGNVPVRIEVVRSVRRHRTVAARPVGGLLRVSIPASMSVRQEERWVREMARRHVRTLASATIDLDDRARTLSRRYRLPVATSVRWSEMESLWGSCTMAEGTIRISSRVAGFPAWVLDYLLVHELAHLVVGDHSPAFWAVVNRYPKAERARGYLIAKSGDDEDSARPARFELAERRRRRRAVAVLLEDAAPRPGRVELAEKRARHPTRRGRGSRTTPAC